VEEFLIKICDYAVLGLVGIMGWFFKSLQSKASNERVQQLERELEKTRDYIYSQLATKEDIKDLKDTINKLLDIQLSRGKK
jgi:glucosamine 6-phosphate synthetase-like amidotransferase/phosphosugar isomerase protein